MFKIEGFDKLQRELKQAERAFVELDGELAEVTFDPTNPSSVESAIADVRLAICRKAAPFRKNPFVAPIVENLIEQYEQAILDKASEAMPERDNETVAGGTLQQTLRSIENTVNDLRRSDYANFDRHIKKLSRLLHSSELDAISRNLASKVDLDSWIKAGQATEMSMVGSARLAWPDDPEAELGLVVALTDRFAEEDANLSSLDFAHQFYYVDGKYHHDLQNMASQTYVPFARDFIDYVKVQTGSSEATLLPQRHVDPASRKVFVIHGHDEAPKEATARFLEQLKFTPVILHEQASKGRTVIEKIEEHGDVGFAIVLLTPDDVGALRGNEDTLRPRARQNALIELGYFIGRLGRARVVALKRGDIEVPSDFDGVVYVNYDGSNGWKLEIGRELEAAGYSIDWNEVMVRK